MHARCSRNIALMALCLLVAWCFAPAQSHAQPEDPRLPFGTKPRASGAGVGSGEFTIAIEGAKQGRFKGEGATDGSKDKLVGINFEYEIKTPRDAATGLSNGKRQHQPLMFTKEWGAASPQLFQAAATNEILKSLELDFHQAGANRTAEIFYTIKLTNAQVVAYRQYEDHGKYLEDVSLSFAKIEVEHVPSKTTSADESSR